MDITKINFSEVKYGVAFETLDVNNDGKINADDQKVAKDNRVANSIKTVLADFDEETELISSNKTGSAKTSSAKDKYGINTTNTANFDNDVRNTKGTVYVIMGNLPGCGYCTKLASAMQKQLDEIEAVANVYNIQWNDNAQLCRSLYKQGGGTAAASFPQIAKFVDGELVGLVDNPRKPDLAVQAMIDGAQGTPETNKAGDTSKTSTKTEADIVKAAEDLKEKYCVNCGDNQSGYQMDNGELQALKSALDDGALNTLATQGFSKTDIIDIISKAFPTSGIKNNANGGFDCPYGHGDDAKALYNQFIDEIGKIDSPELTALRAEVKALNAEIIANNLKLNVLKGSIEHLQEEIEAEINKAIEDSEEIADEQKKEAGDIVSEELNKYTNSEGVMTYEQFQENVSSRLNDLEGDGSGKLSRVMSKLLDAQSKMSVLKGYMTQFGNLVNANKDISDKIKDKNLEITKTESNSSKSCEANRCDPIGFKAGNTEYNFFVDKDNNNNLTNEKELLGADNGWKEMVALDTNSDGKVTADEMKNLKVALTSADGTQTVKDASELFNDGDSIDLTSYKAVNQDDANGNTLLGSFTVNFNGQEIKDGYNTLDKIDWLDEHFEFTDEENGTGRFAIDNTNPFDVSDYTEQYNAFQTKYNELDKKLKDAFNEYNITTEDVKNSITDDALASVEDVDVDKNNEDEELEVKDADVDNEANQIADDVAALQESDENKAASLKAKK